MGSEDKKPIIVAVSGGFDPIHIGHIRMFQAARRLGDRLIVILNNDNWLKKKKNHIFMHEKERKEIIKSMADVDEVILTSHGLNPEDMSVSKELIKIKPDIFANGGDRTVMNIPETPTCNAIGCKMVFNVGQGGKIQSSSWLLAKYINSIRAKKIIDIEKSLKNIDKAVMKSKINLPLKIKLRLSRLILNLKNKKDGFGLFVILGWRREWDKSTDISDKAQDIFAKHHVNIMEINEKTSDRHNVSSTINFDGAILIDKKGNIIHSGVIIEGLRPRVVAKKINPGKFRDLSEQFGFKEKVHARHLAAIASSYVFKNTAVFTVSEETGSFHIFENGKIVYSAS